MTSKDLADRIGEWAEPLIAELEDASASGSRETRLGAVGPLRVRHTFEPDSSHQGLLDSLIGAPAEPDAEIVVHSVEAGRITGLFTRPEFRYLPWVPSDFDVYGRPIGLDESPWRLMWNAAGHEVRCYNRETRVGLFLTAGPVASWEYSSPMLPFWHWVAAAQGAAMVHAGTVGTDNAMGIIGGPSGTGKSTTVLLGMRNGLESCGDDYVWLQPGDGSTQVWAAFRTIKTVAGSPLTPPVSERVQEEGEVRKQIHWVPTEALRTQAPLRLVWVLRDPDDRPPTRIDALSALLPSTLLRVHGDHGGVADVLREVLSDIEVRPLRRDGDFAALVNDLRHDSAGFGGHR